jgi:hypothetical protein
MSSPVVPGPSTAMTPSYPAGSERAGRWRSPLFRLLPVIPLAALAGAAWWVERFNPTDGSPDPTGPCAWHAVTGINGPTCGGTRAFYELLHGNVIEAVRYHLPFVVAVPVLAYWWLAWTVELWTGRRLPRLRPKPWMVITYVVAALVFTTVLRNLPFAPFHWFDIPNLTHRMT